MISTETMPLTVAGLDKREEMVAFYPGSVNE